MLRRAFTLVEILITLVILTVLAAVTVPTYQLILSQLQLNSAVEQASDFVRLAAQKTVTEQQIYGVRFTAGSANIVMFRQNGGTQTTISTTTLPANMQVSAFSFSGASEVRFSTAGAPNVSGNFTIRDTVRNRTRQVEIRPSGNIRNNQAEQ